MKSYPSPKIILLILTILVLTLSACATENSGAQTVIQNPPADAVPVQRPIQLRVLSTDPNGIDRVQLWVNGQLQAEESPAFPQTEYIANFTFTPQAPQNFNIKAVTISKAQSSNNSLLAGLNILGENDPEPEGSEDNLTITASDQIIAVATSVVAAATAPANEVQAQTGPYTACSLEAAFVEETIPVGSQMKPGQGFHKRWRVMNLGTCDWDSSYYLAQLNGTNFGESRTKVPHTTPQDEIATLTVPMIAPQEAGTYSAQWQLFDPYGYAFGPVLNVSIVVVEPEPECYYCYTCKNGGMGGGGWNNCQPMPPMPTGQPPQPTAAPSATPGPPICQPPSNLRIVEITPNGFVFQWQDNCTVEDGYRLYDKQTNQFVAAYPANSNTGSIGNLQCNQYYQWSVRAFNSAGESPDSNLVSGITPACY